MRASIVVDSFLLSAVRDLLEIADSSLHFYETVEQEIPPILPRAFDRLILSNV